MDSAGRPDSNNSQIIDAQMLNAECQSLNQTKAGLNGQADKLLIMLLTMIFPFSVRRKGYCQVSPQLK